MLKETLKNAQKNRKSYYEAEIKPTKKVERGEEECLRGLVV